MGGICKDTFFRYCLPDERSLCWYFNKQFLLIEACEAYTREMVSVLLDPTTNWVW